MSNRRQSLQRLVFLAFVGFFSSAALANSSYLLPAPPQLSATSYYLVDANSGEVLVEHNALAPLAPASLTKMMTIYLISSELAKGTIDQADRVPVSVKAWQMGGSKMFIREGTEVAVSDLMRGIIIQSGNDASVAMAEYIAGSEDAFAQLMNHQAQVLGMNHSYFVNATGWPAENHQSTARDLALLARALIYDFPEQYALYSERSFTYNDITQSNRNRLLWRDSNVDGIKTGHTEEAGYCLVASAVRDDMRLISVVLGTASSRAREQETQKLLSYGFRYFKTLSLYGDNEVVNSVRVWAGEGESVDLVLAEPLLVTVPRDAQQQLEAQVEVDRQITAPVAAGAELGELKLMLQGEMIARRPLLAAQAVAEAGLPARLWDHALLIGRDLLGLDSE